MKTIKPEDAKEIGESERVTQTERPEQKSRPAKAGLMEGHAPAPSFLWHSLIKFEIRQFWILTKIGYMLIFNSKLIYFPDATANAPKLLGYCSLLAVAKYLIDTLILTPLIGAVCRMVQSQATAFFGEQEKGLVPEQLFYS